MFAHAILLRKFIFKKTFSLCTYAFVKVTNFIRYLGDSTVLITENDKVIR